MGSRQMREEGGSPLLQGAPVLPRDAPNKPHPSLPTQAGTGRKPFLGCFLPHFLFLCDSVTLPSRPKAGLLPQTSLSQVMGWAEPHL